VRLRQNWLCLLLCVSLVACSKRRDGANKAKGEETFHTKDMCGSVLDLPRSFTDFPQSHPDIMTYVTSDDMVVSHGCEEKSTWVMAPLRYFADKTFSEVVEPGLEAGATEGARFQESSTRAGAPMLFTRTVVLDNVRMIIAYSETPRAFLRLACGVGMSVRLNDEQLRARCLPLLQSARQTVPDATPTRWFTPPLTLDARSLREARSGHTTKLSPPPEDVYEGSPAPAPPAGVLERRTFRGPVGRLSAYLTPPPRDGKRHPAVVWAHGGFGGIDREFWEPAGRHNDQSAQAFRKAGLVLAVPSFRGENDNEGQPELYLGEVDDLLATVRYVAKLPYVDPTRIYLIGHSSGGTLALLAAELDAPVRAVISIGGDGDLTNTERLPKVVDLGDLRELSVRRAAPFVRSIRRPTFFFEGSLGANVGTAQWMEQEAKRAHVPFQAHLLRDANHFNILAPLTELIAQKILTDTGADTTLAFSPEELRALVFAHAPEGD
jgi:dienelactone hydrolase